MKKTLLIASLMLTTVVTGFSQSDFISYTGPGKVILTKGDTISGMVDYLISLPGSVKVTPEGSKKQKFDYNEVKEFYVLDKHYFTIQVPVIGNSNTFACLMNSETSKIKLFRYEQQPLVVVNNDFTVTTEYYVLLPGEKKANGLGDIQFLPFNKKVSKIVESCPALSKKILDKESGYKLSMLSGNEQKYLVFKAVLEEYDNCK